MGKKKIDDESEVGTDLEQMIAMLEKAEIDYDLSESDDGETQHLEVNGAEVIFDEEGNLQDMGGV